MQQNDTYLIPRPNIPVSYFFGTIFLVLAILGLSSSYRLVFKYDLSWDCFGTGFLILFIFSLRLIFLHRILEFQKEGQSVTIYWGAGIPLRSWFIKLPWIWRDYSEEQIESLRVTRGMRIDGSTDALGYRVYFVEAKIDREWVALAEYLRMKRALDVSKAISEFLGVPTSKSIV